MLDFATLEFLGTLLGIVIGIETLRRHHNNKIEKIKTDSELANAKTDRDLQAYKLHVAETYATKNSVGKQFESVAASIKDVGDRMDRGLSGMNERLDRVIEAGSKSSSSRRSS